MQGYDHDFHSHVIIQFRPELFALRPALLGLMEAIDTNFDHLMRAFPAFEIEGIAVRLQYIWRAMENLTLLLKLQVSLLLALDQERSLRPPSPLLD